MLSDASDKVKVPAYVGRLVGALLVVAGLVGLPLPEFVTEEWVLGIVGAGVFIAGEVAKIVAYYRSESNPAPSAVDAAEAILDARGA